MTLGLKDVKTYSKDGRASVFELNKRYDELESKYGFKKEPVYMVDIETTKGPIEVAVYCYKSAQIGPALWLLSGVHGEEPAGPNAIALNIDFLGQLGQETPFVVFPLLNPKGYYRSYRYPDEIRNHHKGHSVSDSEHYLPDPKDPTHPRLPSPSSEIADKVSKFVLDAITDYPPILTDDHHEDESLKRSYIYSQGSKAGGDEVAKKAISILKESGIPIQKDGFTRFGESVQEGIVVGKDGQPIKDGSIDELLGNADKIIVDDRVIEKPIARTSLVIETPVIEIPLVKRIKAHSNILKQLRTLWTLANK